jgi:threonine aldolase
MGNLIAIALHCGRGNEVLCGDEQHVVVYEQGGVSSLFGIILHTLPQAADGTFALTGPGRSLESAIASRIKGDPHYSVPSCISIENTHNRAGGAVLPQVRSVGALRSLCASLLKITRPL